MAVTARDVAQAAGVSAMTVSKVLNGRGGVSEATRQRVMKVAREMHYSRNFVALSLRVNQTKTIGVILSDSSEMVTSKVLRGIQDEAARKGYSIIMANTDHSIEAERQAFRWLETDSLLLIENAIETFDKFAKVTRPDRGVNTPQEMLADFRLIDLSLIQSMEVNE